MPKAIRFHECGDASVLRFEDLDVGRPGRGEVRLQTHAIGLNRAEVMYRAGHFGLPPLPSGLGMEAAGAVVMVGEGVQGWAVGDQAAVIPGLLMHEYPTYGEEFLYPADMLAKIPPNVSMEQAAASWMQFLTAYGSIAVGRIAQGDPILITAASSSVGLAAIQIANAVGAVPIAVTRSNTKKSALEGHGARHVVVTEKDDLLDRVMQITAGQGVRVIFDSVGGSGVAQLIDAVAVRGIVILYGTLGGAVAQVPIVQGMEKGVTLRCFTIRDVLADPGQRAAAMEFIGDGLASGRLSAVIDRIFPFERMAEAHEYMEANTQVGKIVVRVR
jgi:NADPH2:quinone reductase